MARGQADLSALQHHQPAQRLDRGQHLLLSRASLVEPVATGDSDYFSLLKNTKDVARWQNVTLTTGSAAKQLAVNSRFITYCLKAGQIRVIHQNGKDKYKLPTSGKERILDLAMQGGNATSRRTDQPVALYAVDESSRMTMFSMQDASSNDELPKKKIELRFNEDGPRRVIPHSTEFGVFLTAHSDQLVAWSLSALGRCGKPKAAENVGNGYIDESIQLVVTDDVRRECCAVLPLKGGIDCFQDAAFSLNGGFLAVLTAGPDVTVTVVSFSAGKSSAPTFQVIQEVAVCSTEAWSSRSIHFLASPGLDGSEGIKSDLLVLGANYTSNMLLFDFDDSNAKEPLGELLQSISFSQSTKTSQDWCLESSVTGDFLTVGIRDTCSLYAIPIIPGWRQYKFLPATMVQHLGIDKAATQLAVLSGKSIQAHGRSMFIFHAQNMSPWVDLRVHEVPWKTLMDASDTLVASKASLLEAAASQPSLSPSKKKTESTDMDVELSQQLPEVPCTRDVPEADHPIKVKDVVPCTRDVPQADHPIRVKDTVEKTEARSSPLEPTAEASSDLASASESRADDRAKKKRDEIMAKLSSNMDHELLRQLSNWFTINVDKNQPQSVQKIVTEVNAVRTAASQTGSISVDSMEQAVTKMKDAREAYLAHEKSIQQMMKDAAKGWSEQASSHLNVLVQKKLSEVSDGIVADLVQQLTQSKTFCNALSSGIQKSGNSAVAQALEGIGRQTKGKGKGSAQDTIGVVLEAALDEALTPALETKLQTYMEQSVAPLIGKQIQEATERLRESVTRSLEGLLVEHEKVSQRISNEVTKVLRDELVPLEQAVRRAKETAVAEAGKDIVTNSSNDGRISEAQLDELVSTVQAEVVEPLQSRVRDLTAQVHALKDQVQIFEQVHQGNGTSEAAAHAGNSRPAGMDNADAQKYEAQAQELKKLYSSGNTKEAFVRAMQYQNQAGNNFDFMARICRVAGTPEQWLKTVDLEPQLHMFLLIVLAQQLAAGGLGATGEAREEKITWMTELWIEFNIDDERVAGNAGELCKRLLTALHAALGERGSSGYGRIRQLTQMVEKTAAFYFSK